MEKADPEKKEEERLQNSKWRLTGENVLFISRKAPGVVAVVQGDLSNAL